MSCMYLVTSLAETHCTPGNASTFRFEASACRVCRKLLHPVRAWRLLALPVEQLGVLHHVVPVHCIPLVVLPWRVAAQREEARHHSHVVAINRRGPIARPLTDLLPRLSRGRLQPLEPRGGASEEAPLTLLDRHALEPTLAATTATLSAFPILRLNKQPVQAALHGYLPIINSLNSQKSPKIALWPLPNAIWFCWME